MRRFGKLEQLQAEMRAKRQMELNFQVATSYRRQGPKPPMRHSGERPCDVQRLLELAAKIPNAIEPQSPVCSTLDPRTFPHQM